MLTQFSTFGTTAGLQVAALAIYATLNKFTLLLCEKIIFTSAAICLFIEVSLILWLINQERKVAFNEGNMTKFKKNERYYRNTLITVMIISWGLILTLLIIRIWFS